MMQLCLQLQERRLQRICSFEKEKQRESSIRTDSYGQIFVQRSSKVWIKRYKDLCRIN